MNLEEKTKLFGHYLGCEVKSGRTTITMQSIDINTGCVGGIDNEVQLPIEDCKLVLKELNMITRKDAMICASLANLPSALYRNWQVGFNNCGDPVFTFPGDDYIINYRNMIVFKENRLNFRQVDYLRNSGYLINVPDDCYVIK